MWLLSLRPFNNIRQLLVLRCCIYGCKPNEEKWFSPKKTMEGNKGVITHRDTTIVLWTITCATRELNHCFPPNPDFLTSRFLWKKDIRQACPCAKTWCLTSCHLWPRLGNRAPIWQVMYVLSHFSHMRFFAATWTIPARLLYPWGFSRQEYWNGLPLPSPGDLPDPEIKPASLYASCTGMWVLYH